MPKGQPKPVTDLALTQVTDQARMIAHLAHANRQDR